MSERTGDTRSRIKAVALDLFTEQGYEKTSLREIAERLGVTKAALYYHFKSKEEIVASFLDDRITHLEEIIDWARQQPPGPQTRRAVIRRYADALHRERNPQVMQFFEQNQPAVKTMPAGKVLRTRMLELVAVLGDAGSSPADELRNGLAIFALHTAWLVVRREDLTDEQRREIALEVAFELVDRRTGADAAGAGASGSPEPAAPAASR
jgi:AcrR family transcriptional regulator